MPTTQDYGATTLSEMSNCHCGVNSPAQVFNVDSVKDGLSTGTAFVGNDKDPRMTLMNGDKSPPVGFEGSDKYPVNGVVENQNIFNTKAEKAKWEGAEDCAALYSKEDDRILSTEDRKGEGADGQDAERQDSNPKAPDGGYGWFVVLGCFIAHVVLGGLDRNEGVFYLLLVSQFGQSAQLTAWPGAICTTLQLVMGPVANVVANRFSARTSVIAGAALMFLGLILNSLAPNFYFFFISHAFILGIGKGLAYAPGLVLVGRYFDKRAGLAAGFGTAGAGVGTFVIVPLAQFLADNYGFFGTFLIMGGFASNMFVSAMLYRPLSHHFRYMQSSNKKKSEYDTGDCTDTDETSQLQVSPARGEHDISEVCVHVNEKIGEQPLQFQHSPDVCLKHESHNDSCELYTIHKQQKQNCLLSSLKICFPIDGKNRKTTSLRELFHFGLLKNPSFLMFCLSIWMFAMSFRAAFTFIPALVESKGISTTEAAMALSVAGAVDTFGRIGSGFFLDLPRLRPYRLILYNLFIFGVAGVAFVLPFLRSFLSFSIMCGLYGCLTGAYISQKSVVLIDILHADHMASSFGLLIGFQGLGSLLGPPLSGALKDSFGSYDEIFYLGGGLLLVSALLMVLCNIFNIIQKRKDSHTLQYNAVQVTTVQVTSQDD